MALTRLSENRAQNFGVFLSEFHSLMEAEFSRILMEVDDIEVRENLHKILSSGKRLRPLLCALSCLAAGGKIEDSVKLSVAIELTHNATLLHDDIIDENFGRRGNFNKNLCVILGDMMISLAVRESAYYGAEVTKMLAGYGLSASLGEYYDVREKIETAGEEYYFRKIEKKSASFFAASTHIGAVIGKGSEKEVEALREFGKNIGTAYQLMDDLSDIEEDLKNSCITLPLIRLLSVVSREEKKDLIENFRDKKTDYLKEKIKEFKTEEYCRVKFDEHIKAAKKNLDVLNESEFRECLEKVLLYLTSARNSLTFPPLEKFMLNAKTV